MNATVSPSGLNLGNVSFPSGLASGVGNAALARNQPDVVGVAERDLCLAHVRVAQHPGVRRGGRRCDGDQ